MNKTLALRQHHKRENRKARAEREGELRIEAELNALDWENMRLKNLATLAGNAGLASSLRAAVWKRFYKNDF